MSRSILWLIVMGSLVGCGFPFPFMQGNDRDDGCEDCDGDAEEEDEAEEEADVEDEEDQGGDDAAEPEDCDEIFEACVDLGLPEDFCADAAADCLEAVMPSAEEQCEELADICYDLGLPEDYCAELEADCLAGVP